MQRCHHSIIGSLRLGWSGSGYVIISFPTYSAYMCFFFGPGLSFSTRCNFNSGRHNDCDSESESEFTLRLTVDHVGTVKFGIVWSLCILIGPVFLRTCYSCTEQVFAYGSRGSVLNH